MDFKLSDEDVAYRTEVETWVRSNLPGDWDSQSGLVEGGLFARDFIRRLGHAGYIAAGWPKEYGGQELGFVRQAIVKEVLGYYRTPHVSAGNALLPPILMTYGTDEQKAEHLPLLAGGERHYCQWFSEPNAGSDMANTQTTAVADGDDFVVNGVKLWHDPDFDWGLLMARTDPNAPKHRGISFFLMDRNVPGVTVQPLDDLSSGPPRIAQTFFDNARVPKKNLVGEVNRGWYVAMATMNQERSGSGGAAQARRNLDDFIAFTRSTRVGGRYLLDDAVVKHRVAELAIETELARTWAYYIASQMQAGLAPDVASSENKLFGSEAGQRLIRALNGILSLYGQLMPASTHAPLHGHFANTYMTSIPSTIAVGTSEVQRSIIATRGLGLPRG